MERDVHGVRVRGVGVGPETRCRHYAGDRDVVAIRFACCGVHYACVRCHGALTDHARAVWPSSAVDQPAVLCGVCGTEHAIEEYLGAGACPACAAPFNPGCSDHYHLYFEEPEGGWAADSGSDGERSHPHDER